MMIDYQRLRMNAVRYFGPSSSVSFWHTPIAPVFYNYPTLCDYYIDLTAKTSYKGPYDANRIPMLDYCGHIGVQYNPCAIAQYGLGAFARWLRGEENSKATFLKAVQWIMENAKKDRHGTVWWRYQFDLDAYGVKAPWVSALAQAQCISILLRRYKFGGKFAHLEMAESAAKAMLLSIEEGGLLRIEGDDYFLEEVVTNRKTAILDGMLFSIFGLQDLNFVNPSKDLEFYINSCIKTVIRILPKYDLGYWSRSDLYQDRPPMVASFFYHRLHIAQLQVMYAITGNKVFKVYADRWGQYACNPISRLRALVNKAYFKFAYY